MDHLRPEDHLARSSSICKNEESKDQFRPVIPSAAQHHEGAEAGCTAGSGVVAEAKVRKVEGPRGQAVWLAGGRELLPQAARSASDLTDGARILSLKGRASRDSGLLLALGGLQ